MEAVRRGGDRQELHEKLRVHARASAEKRARRRRAGRPLRADRRGCRVRHDAGRARRRGAARKARRPRRRTGRGLRPRGARSRRSQAPAGSSRRAFEFESRERSGGCSSPFSSRFRPPAPRPGPLRPPLPAPRSPRRACLPAGSEEGIASWYGGDDGFEGKPTASGEIYDSSLLTAAHRELPLGTIVDGRTSTTARASACASTTADPSSRAASSTSREAAAGRLDLIGPGTGRVRSVGAQTGQRNRRRCRRGSWAVQVGSFAEPVNARRHAERARAAGRSVYLEPYNGLTRVKVGAYGSRGEAGGSSRRSRGAGFEGIVVPAR